MFRSATLENENRCKIYAAIQRWPGLNISALAGILDTSTTNVSYHLKQLEHRRMVERRPGDWSNEVLCFLPEDVELWEDPQTRPLFSGGTLLEVAIHLVDHPGARRHSIAQAIGKDAGTIHNHLKTLRENELLHRDHIGESFVHVAADRLIEWIEAVGRTRLELEEGRSGIEFQEDCLERGPQGLQGADG